MATSPDTPAAPSRAAVQAAATAELDARRERMRARDDWRVHGGHRSATALVQAEIDYRLAAAALAEITGAVWTGTVLS
jgi:hypothetical protein